MTPEEHAEALAWVQEMAEWCEQQDLQRMLAGYRLAEAVLTRHKPFPQGGQMLCPGCRDCWPCPDAVDALAFVKAVRG